MKLIRNFDVEIDGAVFTFRKPTTKDFLRFSEGKPLENIMIILGTLEKVTGLQYDDGQDVSADTIRTCDLDTGTVIKITQRWNEEVAKLQGRTPSTDEKKT